MIGLILLLLVFQAQALQNAEVSVPRTVDQCYGQPIPVACDPGQMVKVNNAFYRQTQNCRGGFRSNYCSKEEPSNPACVGNQTCIFTTPWIYLSSECGYSNNFMISYQCVPISIQHDICQEEIIHSGSGYIVSPNYPNKYPKSLLCQTKVKVRPGQKIKVYLLDLFLAYYNYDVDKQCVDTLWIVDDKERTDYLCSGKQRDLIFTSQSNEITVFFKSEGHEYLNSKGFWLYYEGETANDVQQRKFPYAKKTSSRRHWSDFRVSEGKMLSQLPIQVTPSDSSIVPSTSKVEGDGTENTMLTSSKVALAKNLKNQGHLSSNNKLDGNNYHQGQPNHAEITLDENRGSRQHHFRRGKKTNNWVDRTKRIPDTIGEHEPSSLQTSSKHYPKQDPGNKQLDDLKNVNARIKYKSRENAQNESLQVAVDDMKQVIVTKRVNNSPERATEATSTKTNRKYVTTRRPYEPTARMVPETRDYGNDIMQINMYNAQDEEEELFNLLSKSGELVKGLKTSIKVPGVNNKVKIMQVEEPVQTAESQDLRQSPLVTDKPIAPDNVFLQTELPATIANPTPTLQAETPVPSSDTPEPPRENATQTTEAILPWNSAFASQIKGIEKKEEAATGGIVGGAAGCILLILAFVVLAIFWRRRHPHEKGGFPFSRRSPYNDIIMAYAPSEAGSVAGASNFAFDECPPPATLKEFPLEACVNNPNYVGPMQSWRNLLPIDEVPEIIYAQNKEEGPGTQHNGKQNKSMLWMRSKSLDDLCTKIGNKVTKRRKKPPDPPILQTQSLDCLKRAYENVILPASYHSMMTAEERPPPVMQRRASLTDLRPHDLLPPPPLSPAEYDLHLQAMQQHMHQQQLQQQQYLMQQQAVFQQQMQSHQPMFSGPAQHQSNPPRPGYESLCLDGAGTSAALQQKDIRLLSGYEATTLRKTPAPDEVAL